VSTNDAIWAGGAGRELAAFALARAAEVEKWAQEHERDSGQCDDLTGIHLDRPAALALVAAVRLAVDQYQGSVRAIGEPLSVPDRRVVQAMAAIWADHPHYQERWKL
jgi:Family of unknown function (DUF6221)